MRTMSFAEVETIARLNRQRILWEPRATRLTANDVVHIVVDDETGAFEMYRGSVRDMDLVAVVQ